MLKICKKRVHGNGKKDLPGALKKCPRSLYFPLLKGFSIFTDAKTCSYYLGEIQVCLIFSLNFIYQRHHHRLELWNLYSLQPPYLQKYTDAVAEKGAPLYKCFAFLGGTIACIYIRVLNERLVCSHDTLREGRHVTLMV